MAINLLPEGEKKELKLEEVHQKLFSALVFVLIFLIFFVFILFSLKIYITSETKDLKNIVSEKEKELRGLGFQDFKKIINQTNQNLAKIQKFSENQIFLTPLFEKLSTLKPPQIYFTSFSFQKRIRVVKEEETAESRKEILADFYISGWADKRETLFLFKKNLEKVKEFQELYFTPTSWISPSEVEFSFSFQIKIR